MNTPTKAHNTVAAPNVTPEVEEILEEAGLDPIPEKQRKLDLETEQMLNQVIS